MAMERVVQTTCMRRAYSVLVWDVQTGSVAVTDAAFVHLRGIHTLGINRCDQLTITDAAFAHLQGIYILGINRCNQVMNTDAAFVQLRGIQELYMRGCNQATISGAALVSLRDPVSQFYRLLLFCAGRLRCALARDR